MSQNLNAMHTESNWFTNVLKFVNFSFVLGYLLAQEFQHCHAKLQENIEKEKDTIQKFKDFGRGLERAERILTTLKVRIELSNTIQQMV